MALNTHYINRYKLFIAYCRSRKLKTDCYIEIHHIKPKCLGGLDIEQNMIKLSAREHYIAHWMLSKCFTKGYKLIKLLHAFGAMSMQCAITPKQYARLKLAKSEALKLDNPMHKPENRAKCSQPGKLNGMYGKTFSKETRARMSKSHIGKKHDGATKLKISKAHKGKIVSDETRAKLSKALKGNRIGHEKAITERIARSFALVHIEGKIMRTWHNAKLGINIYCSAICLKYAFPEQSLDAKRLRHVATGIRKSHKNWQVS